MTSTIDAARQVQRREHQPEPIEWIEPDLGPYKMLEDFRRLGTDVDAAAHHAVEGYAPVERVQAARPRRM